MSTPNPLMPQGSLQKNSRGNPNVRIAVFTIIAIHAVFFVGLLMQGCKRDTGTSTSKAPEQNTTKTETAAKGSNYIRPLDTNYYSDYRELARKTAPENATSSTTSVPKQTTGVSPTTANPPAAVRTTTGTPESVVSGSTTGATETAPQADRNSLPKPFGTAGAAPGATTSFPVAAVQPRQHKIEKGDMLVVIAKKYGVSLNDLLAANPDVDPRRLRVGKVINVPAPTAAPIAAASNQSTQPDKNVHLVQRGETLIGISKKYGITVRELKSLNNLMTDRILVNQKLKVPELPSATASNNVAR